MEPLEQKDQERVNAAYEAGAKDFSKSDLDDILSKEDKAKSKAKNLGDFWEEFVLLWDLLKDYKSGAYTEVPWKFIAAVGFTVLYLINPFDVIPDVLPIIGYFDDTSVWGLVLAGFKSEIDAYKVCTISKKQKTKYFF